MAEFKTTVALEIGAQSVTMGVFTPSGKGFALSRYARRDILLDPVEEGMRMDYVSNAIGEMVAELKVKGSDVRNIVSGQQVFMRFIKLPAIDIDDIAEHVGYEAQQHIPFPIEDITYSYQVLPEREPGEQEILLVAIKKDVLDSLNEQVEEQGLNTLSVDCSITALYNAYRISYPEDELEPVVILDIGAKTTDIIFSENGRFFTRSVTAAGAFITNSIAREFNMSFRDAEQLKIESGMVSLGNGFTDNMTEQDAALATTIRTAMSRLSSEVQRTINHYRAQYKGSAPTKAYICGGGARMPYAVEFLQAALNIPVEYLNPINAFKIGSKVDQEMLAMDTLCLGPIAGATISGAKIAEFDIDLVPTSVGKDRAELKMLPKIAIGGLIALVGAGIFAGMTMNNLKKAEATEKKQTSYMTSLRKPIADLAKTTEAYNTQQAQIDELINLFRKRTEYTDLIKHMSTALASDDFWITEMTPLHCGTFQISAEEMFIGNDNCPVKTTPTPNETGLNNAFTQKEGAVVNAFLIKGYVRDNGDNSKNIIRAAWKKLADAKVPLQYFNVTDESIKKGMDVKCVEIVSNPPQDTGDKTYIKRFQMLVPINRNPYNPAEELAAEADAQSTFLSVPKEYYDPQKSEETSN